MLYSSQINFLNDISTYDPDELVKKWLMNDHPYVFQNKTQYGQFIQKIMHDWPESSSIHVAGTSNWRYSLNPKKDFGEFHDGSDVDVVVISLHYFEKTWEEIRSLHRKFWYSWPKKTKDEVLRSGENIYCGFINPKSIPEKRNDFRFEFLQLCNSYSTKVVGYRDVNMMFFKCYEDAVDYYIRGVRLAKRRV